MNPYGYGGQGGGLTPLRSLSQAVFPPQRGGAMGLGRGKPSSGDHSAMGANSQGAEPRRATLRGWFPSNPPQMAPLILGLLGFAGSIPGRFVTDLYRFFQTFLGEYS